MKPHSSYSQLPEVISLAGCSGRCAVASGHLHAQLSREPTRAPPSHDAAGRAFRMRRTAKHEVNEVELARAEIRTRAQYVEALRAELLALGYLVAVVHAPDGDRLWIDRREGPLSRGPLIVTCTRADDGSWWFGHPWGGRLAPADDVPAAARQIATVLDRQPPL